MNGIKKKKVVFGAILVVFLIHFANNLHALKSDVLRESIEVSKSFNQIQIENTFYEKR